MVNSIVYLRFTDPAKNGGRVIEVVPLRRIMTLSLWLNIYVVSLRIPSEWDSSIFEQVMDFG